MLCAERAEGAEPLHLTTVAVFVLPWPVSHGNTTGFALIPHRGFWCNQQLAKDLTQISSTSPKKSARLLPISVGGQAGWTWHC